MRLNFRWKLFLGFFGFALVLAGGLIWFIHATLVGVPEKVTRELLRTAVANAVRQIDPADIAAVTSAADPQAAPQFAKLHDILEQIEAAPPYFRFRTEPGKRHQKDIYILVRTDEANVARLLVTLRTAETNRSYDMSRFPAMMQAWSSLAVDPNIGRDEYGRTLSAYAPIKDAQGKTLAVLGIDAPAEYIDAGRQALLLSAWIIFALALVLALPAAFFIAYRLNRPILLLHDGMRSVAAGKLDTRIPPLRTRDEFEPLIDRFNMMVEHLRERDRLKRDIEVAQVIQRHLLPDTPPPAPGFEIADCAAYCDATGGDYFDYIPLPEPPTRRLALVVADVTGHGVGAALLMASTRAILRSHAPQFGDRLDKLFHEVNAHLYQDTDSSRFVTLYYGVLDTAARTLTYASAGHEPALWFHAADQTVTRLESTGLPLGVAEDAEFERNGPIQLAPGDVIAIGTDGIREAGNAQGEQFGLERMTEVLRAHAGKSAQDIHHAITRAVVRFRGDAPQMDDLTLVVVKVD